MGGAGDWCSISPSPRTNQEIPRGPQRRKPWPPVVLLVPRASEAVKHPVPLSQPCGLHSTKGCCLGRTPACEGFPKPACTASTRLESQAGDVRACCRGYGGLDQGCNQGRGAAVPCRTTLPCVSSLAEAVLPRTWAKMFWVSGANSPAQAGWWEGTGSSPQQQAAAVPRPPRSPWGGEQPSAPSASVLQS